MKKQLLTIGSIIIGGLAISSCNKLINSGPGKQEYVYVETNDFTGQNAVLAYKNTGTGKLQPVPGSPFATGGVGIANPTQGLGPDDSDTQLITTPDGKYLLAVNSGGNSIAVFTIRENGGLSPVSGSPFNSGGENPVSLAYSNGYLYVVNKSNDTTAGTPKPNYATFKFNTNGSLTFVSKVETTTGVSPSQVLLSGDGKFAFGTDFLGFMHTPPVGTLRSFSLAADTLQPVNGTPYTIPAKGGALGLWQNPGTNILYVGFPLANMVGIYQIDPVSGSLAYQSSVTAGAAVCWLRTTKDGKYLYTLNSGENSVSVFNTASPASPVSITKVTLKDSGPIYINMGLSFTTSEDFSLGFSPDENNLYIVSQYTNADFTLGNYNLLHVLVRSSDGRLTEINDPEVLPVRNTLRPQGVAVAVK